MTRGRLLAVLAVVLLGACGGGETKHNLTVRLAFNGTVGQGTCTPTPGYSDITSDAPVTVKDEAGKLLGTATLGIGQPGGFRACRFSTVVAFLPTAKFYQVEVSHRGAVSKSYDDLKAKDWTIELTLGE